MKQSSKGGWTLFELTIVICFFSALFSAVGSAKTVQAGPGGYAIAVAAGVVIGAALAVAMGIVYEKAGNQIMKMSSESFREWCLGALLLMTCLLLIPVSMILARWVTLSLCPK
jgi:hypothetical protein